MNIHLNLMRLAIAWSCVKMTIWMTAVGITMAMHEDWWSMIPHSAALGVAWYCYGYTFRRIGKCEACE